MSKFRATALLNEEVTLKHGEPSILLDINVSFGSFDTKEDAERIANKAEYLYYGDHILARVFFAHLAIPHEYHIEDKDITFKKLKAERQASMGKPIDCSTPEGKKKATEVLMNMDESYFIDADDMEAIELSLVELKDVFKRGGKFDCIAIGSEEVTDNE